MTALLAQGALLGFWSALSPGPFQAYLVAQSLRNGPARTLPVAIVPLLSDPPVIAIVLAVLAQLPGGFLRALQLAGGVFVLWLAWTTLRAALRPAPADVAHPPPRGIVRAVALNFTNPNAWIFWSVTGGPILAQAWRVEHPDAFAFLVGFYALLLAGNAAVILLFGSARRLGPGFTRTLGLVSAAALVVFGAWQLGRGVTGA